MTAPLSPPQLRMICPTSAATNITVDKEKEQDFSFCHSPHFASDDLEIICNISFSTTKLFRQIKTLKSTDNAT